MPIRLPPDTLCWIDANIIYYSFVETPVFTEHCQILLNLVNEGQIQGVCDAAMLAP